MTKRPPRRAGYFFRAKPSLSAARLGFHNPYCPEELVELTGPELRTVERLQGPFLPRYKRIDASRAHRFVRNGGLHHTGLWIDCDGRIRYAEGGGDLRGLGPSFFYRLAFVKVNMRRNIRK